MAAMSGMTIGNRIACAMVAAMTTAAAPREAELVSLMSRPWAAIQGR
jgi:hypothetical protein